MRYDGLAHDPLKEACVEVEEDPCPICEDLDGDGFGFGPDCAGADCDDGNAMRTNDCLYVAPFGSDANRGTDPSSPWATLDHAVAELRPGDSLVLLPGLYEAATTGLLAVACGEGGNAAADASASAPISIRGGRDPTEERQAILSTDGSMAAIDLAGCEHWKLHGLTARGADLDGGASSIVVIEDSAWIEASRLLVSSPNGLTNSAALRVSSSTDIVVIDSEIYDFHIAGVYAYESERITLRRVYVNSREREDPPGTAAPSNQADTGDYGIRLSGGSGHRIENCVVADSGYAFFPGSEADVDITGSIGLDLTSGILSSGGVLRIHDFVVANSDNHGIDLRSPSAVLDGVTVLGSGLSGLLAAEDDSLPCAERGGCTFIARNVLSAHNAERGIFAVGMLQWSVLGANAFDNETDFGVDEPIDDAEGIVQNSLSEPADDIGLELGQCAVFIREGSAMKGRGIEGADIGANVLYRIVDGEITEEPLWDPQSGGFPCGAIVTGINDVAGQSCFDVHERLNVGHDECPLPLTPSSCDATR
jgi:hypothetical protein